MTSSCILQIFLWIAIQYQRSVVLFVIRSGTFFDGSKGFVLFSEEYKKSEPFSYREKVRIFIVWRDGRDSNPGPTDQEKPT